MFWKDSFCRVVKCQDYVVKEVNVDKMMIALFDRVENTEGKGENAGYHYPTFFSKAFFFRVVKSRDGVLKS